MDKALENVSKATAIFVALESRLEDTANDIDKMNGTIQNAQSRIGDANIAKEMLKYS